MRVCRYKLHEAFAFVVDGLSACLLVDKSEWDHFKKLSELAVWLVGSSGIREDTAAFEKDLMQIRYHTAGVAQSVPFGKEIIYECFMVVTPVLLCTAGSVQLSFLFEFDLFTDKIEEPLLCTVVLRTLTFDRTHDLNTRSIDHIGRCNKVLGFKFTFVNAEYGSDRKVDIGKG